MLKNGEVLITVEPVLDGEEEWKLINHQLNDW
jgi:hypothetical protein